MLNLSRWPIPPIQSSQIIGCRITALRHIAEGRPAVSPIDTLGQQETFDTYDFFLSFMNCVAN